jgi:hypothetical protein
MQRVASIAEADHGDAKVGAVRLIQDRGGTGARLEHRGHASTRESSEIMESKTSAFMARDGV